MFIQVIWTNLSSIKLSLLSSASKSKIHILTLAYHSGKKYNIMLLHSVLSLERLMLHSSLGTAGHRAPDQNVWKQIEGVMLQCCCCSAAPPGCLRDTGRLASKGHPAERRIYHPGKNSQFRLSSKEEIGSASSACRQPRRDVLSCPGWGVPAGVCCCAAPQHVWAGVSLQWATGSRAPLPHQQQFKRRWVQKIFYL